MKVSSPKQIPPDHLEGKPLHRAYENEEFEFEDISRLFDRSSQPPKVFPVEALGEGLAEATKAIYKHGVGHFSTCATAVIGSVSASISPHLDVEIWDREASPSVIWIMHLAESGTGKSQVINQTFKAFHDSDKARQIDYGKRTANWHKQSQQNRLDSLPIPERPQNWRRWLEDITVAKLARRLSNSSLAPVWLVDEGATFTDGYDFQAGDRQLSAAATLSKLFSGKQVSYSRATDNVDIAVYGRRLCLVIFTQTQSGLVWAQKPQLNANGLCARFLMSMADERKADHNPDSALAEDPAYLSYQAKLAEYESRGLIIHGGDDPQREDMEPRFSEAELVPFVAKFSNDSQAQLLDMSAKWRDRALRIPETNPMRSLYLRSAEHVGRLAGLLCAYEQGMEWLYQNDIPARYVQRAKKIVEWFHYERRRIIGSDNQNTDDMTESTASILMEWLGDAEEMMQYRELRFIKTREIARRGPNILRKKDKRDQVVEYLTNHGYLVEHKVGKSKYLVINPEA